MNSVNTKSRYFNEISTRVDLFSFRPIQWRNAKKQILIYFNVNNQKISLEFNIIIKLKLIYYVGDPGGGP